MGNKLPILPVILAKLELLCFMIKEDYIMAQIICPECEKRIDGTASNCPNCGCRFTPGKKSATIEKSSEIHKMPLLLMFMFISILLVVIGVFIGQGEEGNDYRDAKQASKIMQHNINELEVQTNSIGMDLVWIPAGEFMMGSNNGESDEK